MKSSRHSAIQPYRLGFFEAYPQEQSLPIAVRSLGIDRAEGRDYGWSRDDHQGMAVDGAAHTTLQFTLSGEGRFYTPEAGYQTVRENDFFCCSLTMDYRYDLGKSEHWEYVWICLTGSMVDELLKPLWQQHGPVVRLNKPIHGRQRLLEQIETLRHESDTDPYALSSFAYEWTLGVLQSCVDSSQSKGGFAREAKQIVLNHIRHVTVEDLAQHFHFHPKYFSSVCKTKLGVTPRVFIESTRLEYAASLLRHTAHAISHVSDACGYRNTHYFCRCFKQMHGLTPLQYRKRSKGQQFDDVRV